MSKPVEPLAEAKGYFLLPIIIKGGENKFSITEPRLASVGKLEILLNIIKRIINPERLPYGGVSLREGVFLKYANKGLEELIKKYRHRHTKKTGNRFSVDGVAYQIGPVEVKEEGALELEISSKIPLEKFNIDNYVKMLEQEFLNLVKRTIKIRPVRKKTKRLRGADYTRAYFVFTTILSDEDLYDNEEISKKAEDIMSGKLKLDLSDYYAWPSLAGRLVLRSVKSSAKKEAENLLVALIAANGRVIKYFSEH